MIICHSLDMAQLYIAIHYFYYISSRLTKKKHCAYKHNGNSDIVKILPFNLNLKFNEHYVFVIPVFIYYKKEYLCFHRENSYYFN